MIDHGREVYDLMIENELRKRISAIEIGDWSNLDSVKGPVVLKQILPSGIGVIAYHWAENGTSVDFFTLRRQRRIVIKDGLALGMKIHKLESESVFDSYRTLEVEFRNGEEQFTVVIPALVPKTDMQKERSVA